MDTLKVIQDKVEILSSTPAGKGLSAVVRHLEVAESHYARAQENGDQDLFTDVIYRTNHAFEGVLREAYTLLAEKNPRNKQTHQIERYFSDNQVFRPRVTELFTQYRTQWRNPSTHEHQLSFTQQEAFLSILSVTSFVSILIDQMIEKVAFDSEKSVEKTEAKDEKEIEKLEQMPLLDKVSYLLPKFYRQMQGRSKDFKIETERQLVGRLHAFLDTSIPDTKIQIEPVVSRQGITYRPDFLLSRDNEKVILEVRRITKSISYFRKKLESQMLSLLHAANISSGIVFVYPVGSNRKQKLDHIEATQPDQEHTIVLVIPRGTKGNT